MSAPNVSTTVAQVCRLNVAYVRLCKIKAQNVVLLRKDIVNLQLLVE